MEIYETTTKQEAYTMVEAEIDAAKKLGVSQETFNTLIDECNGNSALFKNCLIDLVRANITLGKIYNASGRTRTLSAT